MTDEAKGTVAEREFRDGMFVPGGNGGPGRPGTVCTPEHVRQAKHACRLGATDQELAALLGVDLSVLRRWMITDEDFSYACKVGGDMADARVERGLYQRGVGGTKKIVREAVTKDGDVVELVTIEELPPDPAAASRWLEARKRKDWGVKSVHVHEGDLEVRDSRGALAILVARQIKAASQQQQMIEAEVVDVTPAEGDDEPR